MLYLISNQQGAVVFSVDDVIEYSDLTPWEVCVVRSVRHNEVVEYEVEFLDGDKLWVDQSGCRKLQFESLKAL